MRICRALREDVVTSPTGDGARRGERRSCKLSRMTADVSNLAFHELNTRGNVSLMGFRRWKAAQLCLCRRSATKKNDRLPAINDHSGSWFPNVTQSRAGGRLMEAPPPVPASQKPSLSPPLAEPRPTRLYLSTKTGGLFSPFCSRTTWCSVLAPNWWPS